MITWQPKNLDADGEDHARATEATTTVHVNRDGEDPQEIHAPMTIEGGVMMTSHVQEGDAVVAIGKIPMAMIHAENAAMCQPGWKPSNYSSMPTLRTTRATKMVVVVAGDEGDNHAIW